MPKTTAEEVKTQIVRVLWESDQDSIEKSFADLNGPILDTLYDIAEKILEIPQIAGALAGQELGDDWNHYYRDLEARQLDARLGRVEAAVFPGETGASEIKLRQTDACCGGGPQWGHAFDCPKCPD